ncbi:MAG: hypothetical protein RJQ10_15060 [Haliea sp.]|uniref:hypothetical protein n=1 Tax=Haliea sp. TaxID=1932666 RepID=UPI0032F022ED
MSSRQDSHHDRTTMDSRGQRFIKWAQEPFGSVMVASVATIGSFGFVLSSMWAIQAALN